MQLMGEIALILMKCAKSSANLRNGKVGGGMFFFLLGYLVTRPQFFAIPDGNTHLRTNRAVGWGEAGFEHRTTVSHAVRCATIRSPLLLSYSITVDCIEGFLKHTHVYGSMTNVKKCLVILQKF